MKDYLITYDDGKTTIVTAIDAEHARAVLKKYVPLIKIQSTIKIKKS